MFRVEHDSVGFKISLSDGKRGGYKARDVDEVVAALRHYYATPAHIVSQDNCPLCREGG